VFEAKTRFKECFRVSGSDFSLVQCILFALEENDLHRCSMPTNPSKVPNLISLDLPLTPIAGITRKGKEILTCTQDITRVKLERLRSARLIHHDQMIMTRRAKALNKTNELVSLITPTLSSIEQVISHIKLINTRES
jgi:hypothetical protein